MVIADGEIIDKCDEFDCVSVTSLSCFFVEAIHRERYKSVTFAAGDKCQVRVVSLYNAVRL